MIFLKIDWTIRIADIFTIFAFLLSAISLLRTRSLPRLELELKQLQLEEAKAQREQMDKADVGAKFIRYGNKGEYRLKVFNKGQGKAYNIRLNILDDGNMMLNDGIFPLDSLEEHQSVELPVAIHLQSKNEMRLRFSWDDGSGSNRHKEITVYR